MSKQVSAVLPKFKICVLRRSNAPIFGFLFFLCRCSSPVTQTSVGKSSLSGQKTGLFLRNQHRFNGAFFCFWKKISKNKSQNKCQISTSLFAPLRRSRACRRSASFPAWSAPATSAPPWAARPLRCTLWRRCDAACAR